MGKKFVGFLAVLLLLALLAVPVLAATPEEIEASIDSGLAWLATQQYTDGSWGSGDKVGYTGLAVLKFCDRAFESGYESCFDPEYEYADEAAAGLQFILDSQEIDGSFDSGHQTYQTGIALMALASTRDSDYADEAQAAVDWLEGAQNTDGGWRYTSSGTPAQESDQSNTGYVTLGLVYAANQFGIDISWVDTGLETWVTTIQDPVNDPIEPDDGGSWYTPTWEWVNCYKTGSLLYEFSMLGDTTSDTRVINAVDYIERHWDDSDTAGDIDGTCWKEKNYQAMFTMMKGFAALGIETIDVGGDMDWFVPLSDAIVVEQVDGHWTGCAWGDDVLCTEWALLTLEKVVEIPPQIKEVYVDIKPGSCPNSFNVKDKGVLPVAILGEEDFDVTTIDPASIRLVSCGTPFPAEEPVEGLAPIRWDYEKVAEPHDMIKPEEGDDICDADYCDISDCWAADPPVCTAWSDSTLAPSYCLAWDYDTGDEYQDLTLKFDTQAVVEELGLTNGQGCVKAKIVGNLLSDVPEETGLPLFGYDNLRVLLTGVKK